MLARSGPLPTRGDYAFEVKWDGFRAIVSTEGTLRVRSRRGWDMTPRVTFLSGPPVRAILDGELVALDSDGKPDFPPCARRCWHTSGDGGRKPDPGPATLLPGPRSSVGRAAVYESQHERG